MYYFTGGILLLSDLGFLPVGFMCTSCGLVFTCHQVNIILRLAFGANFHSGVMDNGPSGRRGAIVKRFDHSCFTSHFVYSLGDWLWRKQNNISGLVFSWVISDWSLLYSCIFGAFTHVLQLNLGTDLKYILALENWLWIFTAHWSYTLDFNIWIWIYYLRLAIRHRIFMCDY